MSQRGIVREVFRWLSLICFVGLCLLIMVEAGMDGQVSSDQSEAVSKPIYDAIGGAESGLDFDHLVFLVRKILGHFGLFGLTGGLGMLFITLSFKGAGLRTLATFGNLVIGSLLALFSELEQGMTMGRGPSLHDVVIDACGFFTVVIIWYLIILGFSLYRSNRQRKREWGAF